MLAIVTGGIFTWHYFRTQNWTGIYKYSESAPTNIGSNQTWAYELKIYKENGQLKAQLNIDGFQTLVRIQAVAREQNKNLDIILDSYRPENIYQPYQKGDLLFTLQKISKEKYKIAWNKLQPNLLNTASSEFERSEK